MPIKIDEAKKYKGYTEDEVKIASFLTRSKGNAFTVKEIEKGIGKTPTVYTPDQKGSQWTWENVGKFALDVVDGVFFRDTLRQMVKEGKIGLSEVAGTRYYFIE